MVRNKVTTETLKSDKPKKRKNTPLSGKVGEVSSDDSKPTKWDKIKGINGKIVRHKIEEQEKNIEMGQLISKGKAIKLYSGVDGKFTYLYYEIVSE
jgi:hypothetical protein|tara:strand:+ start:905 stop:1192 length:288 start_codon:yes stop_codon:yes gene_type:complete